MGKNILTKELLLKSVEEWNAAREANRRVWAHKRPLNFNREVNFIGVDLQKADLRGADLNNVGLSGANFRGADLSGANFTRANLCGANLGGANLRDADFSDADLIAADFTMANLSRANLRGANLNGAKFYHTILSRTNLSEVVIGWTVFGSVNLSDVIGLDSIRHITPSTIGIETIYASNGDIPESFLRGCGVPDNFIEYARSLTANGIEYYSCFISYSHRNEEFAQRLHTDLQANNVRCWFAPHDIPIGAKTRLAIDDAIRIHDKLLLILSEHSVQSNWVEHEVEHALDLETERGKLVLFPVRLDDAVMGSRTGWASNVKRQRNIGDFTRWKDHDSYQKAFSRLLRDLKQ